MASFYQDPYANIAGGLSSTDPPTRLVLFGDLLGATNGSEAIGAYLKRNNWELVWHCAFNGLDILQDDAKRKGGVHVFARAND